jgi:hypothetical protein
MERTMERLFSPCTRLHDLLIEDQNDYPEQRLPDSVVITIKELNLDVSTEEFLGAESAFTYADLYAMIGDGKMLAWLTPHTSVVCTDGRAENAWRQLHMPKLRFCFNADGNEISALARSPEHLLEICDVVLRLLSASVVYSVKLNRGNRRRDAELMNSLALAYLMEKCQSLTYLSLNDIELDENHCRALGDHSRTGLDIEIIACALSHTGSRAFGELLGRNQGPTKLHYCDINNFLLADGLRGNGRLKSLMQSFSEDYEVCNREIIAIASAMRENKGLVELTLRCSDFITMNVWHELCDSLKMHPTLEVLDLVTRGGQPPVVVISRMQVLVDMMKVNTSIHTMYVDSHYSEHEMYRESVTPYLETNRCRPRLLAIQRTRPMAYRAKVLGRALPASRTDANSFWMLLSGNAEVLG